MVFTSERIYPERIYPSSLSNQASSSSSMGREGLPSWADRLGWTGVKGKSFLKEYLNYLDPLQNFKAAQIIKAGFLLK